LAAHAIGLRNTLASRLGATQTADLAGEVFGLVGSIRRWKDGEELGVSLSTEQERTLSINLLSGRALQ
jgi:hypothetical protein